MNALRIPIRQIQISLCLRGELSSEPELLVENQQNLSVTKKAEIQVEKTSVDFFDSSGEDRSEGELSEANSGGKNVKNKVTDDENKYKLLQVSMKVHTCKPKKYFKNFYSQ